ncbi:MAG: hypothetical protein EOM50_05320 [Erysipelotrichia bacterium]|nr:hypothetical protein [Erysipelotrichia bacterium]NCC54558.1 hypothetical protein [Erysipelotrichia bacterium]
MVKIINFNQAAKINQLLKEKGIEYTLHLHAGCAYCVPVLVQDGKEHDLSEIYAVMNGVLKEQFIKVEPDGLNPLNVIVK